MLAVLFVLCILSRTVTGITAQQDMRGGVRETLGTCLLIADDNVRLCNQDSDPSAMLSHACDGIAYARVIRDLAGTYGLGDDLDTVASDVMDDLLRYKNFAQENLAPYGDRA